MTRLILATLTAILGLVVLNAAAPVNPNAGVPVNPNSGVPGLDEALEPQPWPFAQPPRGKGDLRHTFPDTWREVRGLGPDVRMLPTAGNGAALGNAAGRLVVSPRVGIGPLAIRVLWHVPSGLHGTAILQAIQTDSDPPMVVATTTRQLQGRAETVEAHWQLPQGLYDVSGCVAGTCLRHTVSVT